MSFSLEIYQKKKTKFCRIGTLVINGPVKGEKMKDNIVKALKKAIDDGIIKVNDKAVFKFRLNYSD